MKTLIEKVIAIIEDDDEKGGYSTNLTSPRDFLIAASNKELEEYLSDPERLIYFWNSHVADVSDADAGALDERREAEITLTFNHDKESD